VEKRSLPMKKKVIIFDHVTKTYNLYKNSKQHLLSIFFKRLKCKQKKALDDISFEIEQGESVALFGHNGAGKSTILKIITEVCFPTSGRVEVDGVVGALLELNSGFDPEFTGRENIYLKGNILGLSKQQIDGLMDDIINFADIGEYIDQPVRTYSSGMKARLGFSINVNIKPDILIVDEALSVGDAEFKNKCIKKIKEILSDKKTTLLFVTHVTGLAKSFCKRGIVLKKGSMVFDGDIDEAISAYEKMKP
jgi:teichoic acid transport system ATP-binding protein